MRFIKCASIFRDALSDTKNINSTKLHYKCCVLILNIRLHQKNDLSQLNRRKPQYTTLGGCPRIEAVAKITERL